MGLEIEQVKAIFLNSSLPPVLPGFPGPDSGLTRGMSGREVAAESDNVAARLELENTTIKPENGGKLIPPHPAHELGRLRAEGPSQFVQ